MIRHCADIPNREGYTFIGVFQDGTEHKCVVVKGVAGSYEARTLDDVTCFRNLKGWHRNNDKRVLL